MKYIDEYRDEQIVRSLAASIARRVTHPWSLMEICGGQTHTIMKYGLDELLPLGIRLVHGPGCPVCVTPLEVVDKAIEIASRPDVTFASYGALWPAGDQVLLGHGSGGKLSAELVRDVFLAAFHNPILAHGRSSDR